MSLLSSAVHGGSTLPDLMQLLHELFKQSQKAGGAGTNSSLDAFLAWSRDYLATNRPAEIFPVAGNYGLRLTNGMLLQISPDNGNVTAAASGGMASPDTSMPIF